MSRSFSNTLLFETALDSISTVNPLLYNISKALLTPTVQVVEADCGTALGYEFPISYRVEGYIEVQTGLRISDTRLNTLITAGNTVVDVRTLSTCISDGGVCQTCYTSSRPALTIPAIGTKVSIVPEVVLDSDQFSIAPGQISIQLSYDTSVYDKLYVFQDGNLLSPSSYSVSGVTLNLNTAPSSSVLLVVKYMVLSKVSIYNWICDTFSGSLIGVFPLEKDLLPIRKSLLETVIPTQDISSMITALKKSKIGGDDSVQYLDYIKDPVEQALFATLLGSVFLNQ